MVIARVVKVVMVAALAAFACLVAFDNVTDYGANYQFVRHVLSMDTTFGDPAITWRAIRDPLLWQAGYALIIAGEALTGLAFAAASVEMIRHLRADPAAFHAATRFVHAGAGLGFLVWFFGFMVAGGEWFAMWQSPQWNGQQPAFRFYLTMLAVLIYVGQREPDPPR